MTIKINPDLNLNDDALKGFSQEQVVYLFLGILASALVCILLSVLRVPSAFWGIFIVPVIFPIIAQGFRQRNGMTTMEILAKKRRIRSGPPLYYYSTEARDMEKRARDADKKVKNSKRPGRSAGKKRAGEGEVTADETQKNQTAETV